ncbi:hypothetical protein DOTSEDRAFT_51339 [Lecanosticta acicola]|uniref:GAT domain-containing protein n=1 Tax=Lecanosticta acicola TaxID=111012 RepID=A0AAI8YTM2_9PEZI|nr:hypothetical protein DOTSEDRAFT_51339 [Lecanosticta acicola]
MKKRFTGLLSRTKSVRKDNSSQPDFSHAPVDSPEANASRAVRLFCESGSASNGGEEVLHLPVIVESAESSPQAAASAAYQIRKFLTRDWATKPHVQYNAIMLIRILCDNPGPTFTRNFDKVFVGAIKETLRSSKDSSTQQILRETLDALEVDKSHDAGLQDLLQMWRKEKGNNASLARSARVSQPPPSAVYGAAYTPDPQHVSDAQRGGGRAEQLPSQGELASRVEEAKNTAKILLQLVQSTPVEEVLQHELIREFSERCQSAQRSMQTYINCDNPAPDDETALTLIETVEQLSLALSRHQRSVLAARRAMGATPSPNNAAVTENGHSAFAAPVPQAAPMQTNGFGSQPNGQQYDIRNSYGGFQAPSGPPPNMVNSLQQRHTPQEHQGKSSNPFADPVHHTSNPAPHAYESTNYGSAFAQRPQEPAQSFTIEPEPTFSPPQRQNTADLEDAYSDGRVSPVTNRSEANTSPQSPSRPKPGPWHTSDVTPSYLGRQTSAANGLTMHGAEPQEIDGYSQVGRTGGHDRSGVSAPNTGTSGSSFAVSPVDSRTAHTRG